MRTNAMAPISRVVGSAFAALAADDGREFDGLTRADSITPGHLICYGSC